jgi:uncharacterized protein YecE (DUF72 family)
MPKNDSFSPENVHLSKIESQTFMKLSSIEFNGIFYKAFPSIDAALTRTNAKRHFIRSVKIFKCVCAL